MSKFDIIGDIHGHYDELLKLLNKLGYENVDDFYIHPKGRTLIFVGDLIDRGPQIRETILFVKKHCQQGLAKCIAGNHEYNAVGFWTLHKYNKGYYRPHTRTNIIQHYNTVKAFQNSDEEWDECLEWMSELPICLEMEQFRVVHASYHPLLPKLMNEINKLDFKKTFKELQTLSREADNVGWKIDGKYIHQIVEPVLKGIDTKLPEGVYFYDKDGTKRTKSRVKWWLKPEGLTYDIYLEPNAGGCEGMDKIIVDTSILDKDYLNGYSTTEKPIFFGHYWLQMDKDTGPQIQADNVCCLDYSVAKKGFLVAYRFDGETKLDNSKFIYVPSSE